MTARTVFRGGRVWLGGAGLDETDVVVEDGRIVDVGRGLDGDVAVDLAGDALLPGFIDCHVHVMFENVDETRLLRTHPTYRILETTRLLRRTIEAGVTTVRDAAGADAGLRDAVRDGVIPGPRLLVAISMLSRTGGHGDSMLPCGMQLSFEKLLKTPSGIVDSPDDMRRAVRTLIRAGADVLKVATSGGVLSENDSPHHPQLQSDELDALIAEATDAGLKVMAHAQATEGIRRAVTAGVASIEHGVYLDEATAELMVARGTYLVPTLVAPRAVIAAAEQGQAIPERQVSKAREVVEQHEAAFRLAVEAGVRIAMGTDAGVHPHGRNLDELALMAKGGLAAADVLTASSASAADLLGRGHELGRIVPGYVADLVAISGDPFDLATIGDRVTRVWQSGRLTVDKSIAP